MLRSRRACGKDPGPDLERNANLMHERNIHTHQEFCFLPYCQQYWLHHTRYVNLGENRIYKLWEHLVNGTVSTVELAWAPECACELSEVGDLGERFVHWITEQGHSALIEKAIQRLWYGKIHAPVGPDLSYKQLNQVLMLSGRTSRRALLPQKSGGLESLLLRASRRGHQAIV